MSVSKMYPVHIMRTFVCDRLTAAAQEILGAFEKRVEDYEAEIARQRRLLDKVYSHETKLQQTEVPLSGEQSPPNQNSNNESGSRFAPDITKIKDEHEEMCISEERLESQQQKHMTVCDPDVSISHPQSVDPDQQNSANIDSPSHISNKDGESESNRQMYAASAACSDQILLHEISCKAEIQQHAAENNGDVSVHVEGTLNEKSAAVETSAENTLFAECSDELPDQINDNENTASQEDAECFSAKNCDDSKSTPASITVPSQLEKSVEPTQVEKSHDGRPVSTSSTTSNQTGQNGKRGLTKILKVTRIQTSSDKNSILITGVEPTSVEKSQYGKPTSTEHHEQTSQEGSNKKTPFTASKGLISSKISSKVTALSSKAIELRPIKKPKVERRSKRSSVLTAKTKPKDPKTSRSPLRSNKKCSDDGIRLNADSASISGDDPNDATWEPSDGCSDEIPAEEKTTSSLSSKQTQGKKVSSGDAGPTGNNESAQKEKVKEKTPETPVRRLSHRKKISTFEVKYKSCDRSQSTSRSKGLSSKKKAGAASRSKEGTSIKRQNEGQSIDSAQIKRPKTESPSAAKSNEETKHEHSTASTENPEALPYQSDDASGNSAEETENPFKCDRCGKVMSNFKNYKFHMKSHTVAKTFKCDTCGKMFRESWDLNKHLVIHSVEKPFKCDICGNGFNRRYNLDLHVRVHTGEKPYKCNTCGKSFSSCVNMKKHTRIHTGEKPYTCKDCGKEFADSSAYKNHLRVHTGEKPFKCTYCKRKFATRTTLKRHNRTHTGEKPYKCTVCDKNFGHRTDLKGHMRMHTGEKPYKCVVCAEQFATWSKLNKHKRLHPNEPQSSTNKSLSDKKEQNQK